MNGTEKIYIVRHGEPAFKGNIQRCIGHTDYPLSEQGRSQASDLAVYFRDKGIKAVYHSKLQRARQTAEILSDGRYPLVQTDGLEELYMGEWEGLTFSEIREKHPELYSRRGADIMNIAPPGSESFQAGLSRFTAAVRHIASSAGGNIAIVAHSNVIRIFLCETLGIEHSNVMHIPQPYTCLNIFTYINGALQAGDYGIMPRRAPDPDECRFLLSQFGTPDEVAAHCEAVSGKAAEIAESLAGDSGIDKDLIIAAALLHDVAKTEENHAEAGSEYLIKCGYPHVAKIIRSHHDIPREDLERVTDSTIVFYADKLISGTDSVSLEERFENSRRKCLTPKAVASHDLQYEQALKAQELLAKMWHTRQIHLP